jgi:predicted phosphodiesterase
MKIAIISDIHSNLEALQAVEKALNDLHVDEAHFAGDVVGYGPDPNSCTRWIMKNVRNAVMGNHDYAALGLMDIETFNLNARKAIVWNSEQMEEEVSEYLRSLPMKQRHDELTLVHANPRDPEGWNYIFTLWDAEMNFPYFDSRFCFVGHSHQPVAVSMDDDGTVKVIPGTTFPIESGCRYLVNVGSIGQPRDGNPDACFGLLDTDRADFSFIRTPYEYWITQEKMMKVGLPEPLVERLAEGR